MKFGKDAVLFSYSVLTPSSPLLGLKQTTRVRTNPRKSEDFDYDTGNCASYGPRMS